MKPRTEQSANAALEATCRSGATSIFVKRCGEPAVFPVAEWDWLETRRAGMGSVYGRMRLGQIDDPLVKAAEFRDSRRGRECLRRDA